MLRYAKSDYGAREAASAELYEGSYQREIFDKSCVSHGGSWISQANLIRSVGSKYCHIDALDTRKTR